MRQLATIREILDIRPIPNADAIEVALIDGWEVVIAKKDNFKVGDKVVYIEIDSIMPDKPEYEFLRERKFRVRTIKLRGQVSQGLVFPLSVIPCKDGVCSKHRYQLGDDVTDILGVRKYDPQAEQERKEQEDKLLKSKNPIVKFLMRFAWFRNRYIKPRKGGFPSWIVKTDEERIQNKTAMFEIEKKAKTKFQATEKLDGQSATYFMQKVGNKCEFGVCSRNIYLKKPNDSSYWTIARQLDIENVLQKILADEGAQKIVLQGEILGGNIQENKYGIIGYAFYAYNLIIDGKKIPTKEMIPMLGWYGIAVVPVVLEFELPETIADAVEFAKGKSLLADIPREGIVCRNYDRNISFKIINPDFLLKYKE